MAHKNHLPFEAAEALSTAFSKHLRPLSLLSLFSLYLALLIDTSIRFRAKQRSEAMSFQNATTEPRFGASIEPLSEVPTGDDDAASSTTKRPWDPYTGESTPVWSQQKHQSVSHTLPPHSSQHEYELPYKNHVQNDVTNPHRMMEEEVPTSENHVCKRMRYTSGDFSVGLPQDASEAFVSPAFQCRFEEHSAGQESVTEEQPSQPEPVVWWKQRRPRPRLYVRDESVCHVCQNPYDDAASRNQGASPTSAAAMSAKAFLAYFTPINAHPTSALQSSVVHHAVRTMDATTHERRTCVPVAAHHSCCTFCERSDICHKCITTCQNCLMIFCLFCSTPDAGSRLCLDCAALKATPSSDDNDESLMQLD